MIKFFRNIRRKLLTENNFTKYFLYVIGEIVLVVIGILIALSINNWNDSRKIVEHQKKIIQSIKADLKLDKSNLQKIIFIQTEKHNHIQMLLKELPSISQDNKKLLDSLMYSILYINPTFFPIIGSYQSALSSGKLSHFKGNPDISKITSLYEVNFSRLIYAGESLDDRFFKLGENYKSERRTKLLGEMSEIQNLEFQDNIFWFNSMIEFYLRRCNETLQKINEVLALP